MKYLEAQEFAREALTAQVNGIEFRYFAQGEGPLVLCLHGFPDTAHSFRPLVESLADAGYRGVAPFMRGYAPTSLARDGDYSPSALAQDAIALIDHFGAREAYIVGHDWGALAGYAAANLRPDRLIKLVAAGVPHPRRFLLRPSFAQLRRSHYLFKFQFSGWAERKLSRNDFAWLSDLVRQGSPDWAFSEDDLAPIKADFEDEERLRAALAYYRAARPLLTDSDTWRLLTQPVAVPTCGIYGARDGAVGAEMFRGQQHLFSRGLELVRMETGHFMHREAPKEFARVVLEFLRRQ